MRAIYTRTTYSALHEHDLINTQGELKLTVFMEQKNARNIRGCSTDMRFKTRSNLRICVTYLKNLYYLTYILRLP